MARAVLYSIFTYSLIIIAVSSLAFLLLNSSKYAESYPDHNTIGQDLNMDKKTYYADCYLEDKYNQYYKDYYKNSYKKDTYDLMNSIPSYSENPSIYPIVFSAIMDPYPYIYEQGNGYIDSRGHGYFSLDPSTEKIYFQIYLEGMSYIEGDDVEIIEIHLGNFDDGSPILSMCNEIKGKGHCREGPGLSVEGYFENNDLLGPLKNYSFSDLLYILQTGQAYVYVQSDDYPEGEIRGQIIPYY
jgi:hypothetical protein